MFILFIGLHRTASNREEARNVSQCINIEVFGLGSELNRISSDPNEPYKYYIS